MPSIEYVIRSLFEYLQKMRELEEPSIREIANELKWTYQKTHTFTKALEELGIVKLEWTPGPPQRFIVKLTDKGRCILSCISPDS